MSVSQSHSHVTTIVFNMQQITSTAISKGFLPRSSSIDNIKNTSPFNIISDSKTEVTGIKFRPLVIPEGDLLFKLSGAPEDIILLPSTYLKRCEYWMTFLTPTWLGQGRGTQADQASNYWEGR